MSQTVKYAKVRGEMARAWLEANSNQILWKSGQHLILRRNLRATFAGK